MLKVVGLFLVATVTVYSAEIPSYGLLGKDAVLNPDSTPERKEYHTALTEAKSDQEHPVYEGEEIRSQGRARIEPVRPLGPVVKHDTILADQPSASPTGVNRVDDQGNGNGYLPNGLDIRYPDIPYAPGYYYDPTSNNYDMQAPDYMEPGTSTFSLLWSQVPNGRTLVSFVGRTIMWICGSMFTLLLGSLLTVGVCSYTNLCSIAIHDIEPIHEEMRTLITPEKISHAADIVKTAIDKYQKIQKVTDEIPTMRRRRSIFK